MSRQDERLGNVQEEVTSADAEGESSRGAKLTGGEKTLLRVATGPACGTSTEEAEPSSMGGDTLYCVACGEIAEPSSIRGDTLYQKGTADDLQPYWS